LRSMGLVSDLVDCITLRQPAIATGLAVTSPILQFGGMPYESL
jgi:hypothetical protein